jgi:septal ring factor EnvC (AmiA/AmiB activator)
VRDAAVELRSVQSRLVAARSEVAKARGQLAGARAKAAAALAEVERAEAALRAAEAEVDAATERVQDGRDDVGRLARRAYQRGRLDDLRQVLESGEPQDAVARAGLLRSVFRFRNTTLTRLTEDRLVLAGTMASLAAEQRALDDARAEAEAEAQRAREIAERSEQAAARVEALAAEQAAVLAEAEEHRAQDARDYEAAQRASQALAERIRAAAARAEAARVAAAKKAAAAAEAERRRRAAAGQRAQTQAAPSVSATGMLWPAPGRLTSRFGIRVHPIFGDTRFHAGIDIGGGMGARVRAARDGYVTYAGYASGYGTLVVVSHGTVGGRTCPRRTRT